MKKLTFYILALMFFIPGCTFAHQPRIVTDNFVEISNPEVSQAFYGELNGSPVEYQIQSSKDFDLYVGLLVPDISSVKKDLIIEISRIKNDKKEILDVLDGSKFEWTPFYEEYAGDNYLWGPEYKDLNSLRENGLKGRLVPAGDYRIKVYSPSNSGKYSLVTGYLESFPIKEMLNALIIVPQLKLNFFNESIIKVLSSPFVSIPILLGIIIVALIIFIFRFFFKKRRQIY